MANYDDGIVVDDLDLYWQYNSGGFDPSNGSFRLGYTSILSSVISGAVRFNSVPLNNNQSIDEAVLSVLVTERTGTAPVKGRIFGIKETNTANFSSAPGSRPRTTATKTGQYDPSGTGYWRENVTDIVREIIAQGGWTSGNAMGFYVEDNGTDTSSGNGIFSDLDPFTCVLSIRLAAPGNFFPTPKSVSAPTFANLDTHGLKIARPGVDVREATESDLLYTSQKDVLRIKVENQVTTTANVQTLIPHGLGYAPEAICFVRKNGLSFELPRGFGGGVDPVGGGVEGIFAVDSTYLRILTFSNADVYYYIFLDPQAS